MSLHHVLEWSLVGAFLVCGVRQLSMYLGSAGGRGNLVVGALCVSVSAIAASVHQWYGPLAMSILMLLGVAVAWYLQGRAPRRWGLRWLVSAMLLMALFSGGHFLLAMHLDGWLSALQWIAITVPAVAFAAYSIVVARESYRRSRGERLYGLIPLLLATTVLLSAFASVQELWSANCFYAAGFIPLLGAMLLVENREGERSMVRETLPAAGSDLSHTSRLAVVGELTASIAHEINQPLSAILSNVDAGDILLEDPSPSLDELRKIIWDIRRDGLRASDVIRSVRTLAQKREPDLIKLDLNAVVESVVELLSQEMRRRAIGILVTPFWKSVYVRGDQTLLVQVMINLVMNAMDALEAGRGGVGAPADMPPIELKVSVSLYDEIHVRVVDQGSGIPKEQLDQLFDSFYTSKSHGMGLGLSISRSIVSAHGGRILATNNAGPGVTFHIFLPPYSDQYPDE